MTRLPIRARLAAAFALAMIAVLAAAGVFVYVRLKTDLNDSINGGLRARSDAVLRVLHAEPNDPPDLGGSAVGEGDENFAQVVAPDGRVLTKVGGATQAVLTPTELRRARRGRISFERHVNGVEGTARMLARPATGTPGQRVIVDGESLKDRDDALSVLVNSLAIGGSVAVVLASMLGYLLATAGLRPVEAMRRRAEAVSLGGGGGEQERLPLPSAHDEVRRLGETLNEMLGRLERSFERERRFVADASHELRTPIAVVKTELDGALRARDLDPEVKVALVAAVEECDHLAQLAEDLLVIARASEGKLPVRAEELRAREVLSGARDRFTDRAAHSGRAIRIDAPDALTLSADPQRLRQALGNLVDNALRHGAGEVGLAAHAADGGVEIEVSDEGAGFNAGLREQPFERFTRGSEARTRGGAGLGLAIVRAIAEAHGGRAKIVPGDRAAVRIWLPAGVEH